MERLDHMEALVVDAARTLFGGVELDQSTRRSAFKTIEAWRKSRISIEPSNATISMNCNHDETRG
jgi:hypothetical protein